MPKSLRLNVHPRVLHLGEMILKGSVEFSELDEIDKRLLYESRFSLEGIVDSDELEAYELARRLKGDEGTIEMMKANVETVFTDAEVDESALNAE